MMEEVLKEILEAPGAMVLFQATPIGTQCDLTLHGIHGRGTGNTPKAALRGALAAAAEEVVG